MKHLLFLIVTLVLGNAMAVESNQINNTSPTPKCYLRQDPNETCDYGVFQDTQPLVIFSRTFFHGCPWAKQQALEFYAKMVSSGACSAGGIEKLVIYLQ